MARAACTAAMLGLAMANDNGLGLTCAAPSPGPFLLEPISSSPNLDSPHHDVFVAGRRVGGAAGTCMVTTSTRL